jgi:hypothetical protein
VLLPLILLVIAEVSLERLLAPGTVDRVGDWRECRDRLVLAWITEELMEWLDNLQRYSSSYFAYRTSNMTQCNLPK